MDLLLIGKTPINPDHPSGSDIRYEPEFEQLQTEIDKLSSPIAANTVDWKNVVSLSSEILSQKSKDLLVASYMAVGLIHTRHIEGLCIGLKVYTDLISHFWEDLYPSKTRMRGRLKPIEWCLEKAEAALSQLELKPVPPEELDKLKEELERFDASLRHYFEEPLSIGSIQRFVNAIPVIQSIPEKQPEEVLEKEEKSVKETVKETIKETVKETIKEKEPTEVSGEIATSRDAKRLLENGLQQIRQAAAYLSQEEPSNPAAYRLARLAVWGDIDTLPPAENGKTRIPPPTVQVKTNLADLCQKGDWENLRKAAETRLSQFIFWLDLNRFVSDALLNLGERYRAAREAVCDETAFLMHRLPGLENLSFSDGTPFASNETKCWLNEISFKAEGAGGPVITVGSASDAQNSSMMEEEIRKAQALAKEKKIFDAVAIIQNRLQNSFSKKERMQWRLALSQLLINSRETKVAVPHLEKILQDIEDYRIEEWDPEFALCGLKIVWTGLGAQPDEASRKKADETLKRIARIDPVLAMRMKG